MTIKFSDFDEESKKKLKMIKLVFNLKNEIEITGKTFEQILMTNRKANYLKSSREIFKNHPDNFK